MNVLILGYPYARQNYRATFEKSNAYFLLPKVWKIKKGKAEYKNQDSERITTTPTLFHHSKYPFVGGLLKGWMPFAPWHIWRLKRKHQIKLVFNACEPNLLSTLYIAFFSKLLGLKHIVFSWQNVALIHRLLIKINLFFSDGIVCGNQKCFDLFKNITKKPLTVIPLAGLDPEKFKPLPTPHEKITFLFAGAIDYRKGIHILIEAIKKIPHAKLILVGSGSYEKHINHPIISWVDHSQLKKIYQESDIFVYPSISYQGWEEQFGYSMAEASLMELPVIATKTGSISEVVIHEKTGILVEPENVDALAAAMMRLAQDPDLRRTFGKAGREYIKNTYSHERILKKYEDFLHY